jgi:hypothetical protein
LEEHNGSVGGGRQAEVSFVSLAPSHGDFLVKLARRAVETYLTERRIVEPPPETPDELLRKSGVFVTLNDSGSRSLRGCIGYALPVDPMAVATINGAIAAATEDPRFAPVTLEEFQSRIVVEISVLTEPQKLNAPSNKDLPRLVEVGKHGLIVSRGAYSGLLLPQVATEYQWDAEEFLTNATMKAGLSPDAWLVEGTEVRTFEAVIFAERYPAGPVEKRPP